jgi:uncharacterized protein with GYD domain
MATKFIVLLKLTTHGRTHGPEAAKSLETAAEQLREMDGKVNALHMTYGQYDAGIAGECPSDETLTSFIAWINDQKYFSTQTLIGAAPSTIHIMHHTDSFDH